MWTGRREAASRSFHDGLFIRHQGAAAATVRMTRREEASRIDLDRFELGQLRCSFFSAAKDGPLLR